MAYKIKVQTDTLHAAARQLSRAASELDSLCSSLPASFMLSKAGVQSRMIACKSRGRRVASTMRRVNNGTIAAAQALSACERRLTRGRSVWDYGKDILNQPGMQGTPTTVCPPHHAGGGGGGGGGGGIDGVDHPFENLIFDVIGGFGIAGGIISGLIKVGTDPSAKNLSKFVVKATKNVVKWAGIKKHTPYKYRDMKLLGLDKYLKRPSQATKWATRFKNNFTKAFKKGFWDKGKTVSNLFTWGGAALGAAFDNWGEYKDGKISADRAIVEGVAETVGTVALTSAAGALVVALSPVALPGVVVAAGGAAVLWGADYLSKKVFGMGVVEGAGHLVGEVYDGAKYVVKEAGKAIGSAVDKTVDLVKETGAKLVDGVKTKVKWVTNLFKPRKPLFSW